MWGYRGWSQELPLRSLQCGLLFDEPEGRHDVTATITQGTPWVILRIGFWIGLSVEVLIWTLQGGANRLYSGLWGLQARYPPLNSGRSAVWGWLAMQGRDSTSGMGQRKLVSKVREVPLHFLPAGGARGHGVEIQGFLGLSFSGSPRPGVSFRNTFFQGRLRFQGWVGRGIPNETIAFTCFSLTLEVVVQA